MRSCLLSYSFKAGRYTPCKINNCRPQFMLIWLLEGKVSKKHKLCCTIVDFEWCISTSFKPIWKLTTRHTLFLRLRQRQVVSNSLEFQYIRFKSRPYIIHCLQCKSNLKQICKLIFKRVVGTCVICGRWLQNSISLNKTQALKKFEY